ncbi:MAG: hypothetical protein ACOCRO_07750 [Halanaerobiales bacterium]
MDLAEIIEFYGIDNIVDKVENPLINKRGIKFNLPFEPYTNGEPFAKNIETCKDINFWREYIDFLARNRYNCLSLWSSHPFHMMFRLEKYPETCPYSDVELEKYKNLYKFIFGYAKKLGIDVYLITWNIRLTPFVAEGLGLPVEAGKMTKTFHSVRQNSEIVKDYFKECIKTLITTYENLAGIGTNCAEEMVGDAEERHKWGREVYIEAIKDSGRNIPFIIRTNMGNGKIAKDYFIDPHPGKNNYISWKYSNAHMYSHYEPI